MQNVSKMYRLHGSHGDQLIDVLGLQRLGFRTRHPSKDFAALRGISFDVPRGHRLGVVGRNGAGKTTLLKLICGNFSPTQGTVEVNGIVQALMNTGLGFHPEYTGRENVEASLLYNGLGRDEYLNAMEGIVEFCELGDFLDQPFKTYSLGMQARLMFAAATAIKPDILIVDEVLGAGDAYFVAKSKIRIQKLVGSGCTMLLVSHSMEQILELCSEAIWLDQGRIRMQGEAFSVVKSYEEFMHGPVRKISLPSKLELEAASVAESSKPSNAVIEVSAPCSIFDADSEPDGFATDGRKSLLQQPVFRPNSKPTALPEISFSEARECRFEASGGISRWESELGVKVCGFSIVTERGMTNELVALRPAKFVFFLIIEEEKLFECLYGFVVHDLLGNYVTRIFSPPDKFTMKRGDVRRVNLTLNPVQLGPGAYNISLTVLENSPLELINSARRFDQLARSFMFHVELPSSLSTTTSSFYHSGEWRFESRTEI